MQRPPVRGLSPGRRVQTSLAPLCAEGDKRQGKRGLNPPRRGPCPPFVPRPGGAAGPGAHARLFLLFQGLRFAAGMKLVSVALMYLGSLAFLGAETARLDVASQFRKKWNKWALSRGKRELRMSSSYPTGLADVKAGPAQTLIRPQDMKGASPSPEDSPDAPRIRVKRYRQSMNNFQGLRSFGCRFGTCTVQKLAHQIYQFTDKDKDNVAPRSKISPQGYGRRRRRSLPEAGPGRTLMSSKPQAPGAPPPPSGSAPHFL